MKLFYSFCLAILTLVVTKVVAVVQYAGINIPGFDFGVDNTGTYTPNLAGQTLITSGIAGFQFSHFVSEGLKAFRLPVAWQYLALNNDPGTLSITNWQTYDGLVQSCLSLGASLCIIDLHNYARWDGLIVGQGGPTNAQLASFWSQLAVHYAGNTRVAFDLINEPHDLNINELVVTYQTVVAAIRNSGCSNNMILLETSDYASAGALPSVGGGAALLAVTNPDGSTNNLVFSVHQYMDADYSGTLPTCPNSAVGIFQNLGNWMRGNKRLAFVTEIGGGPGADCVAQMCAVLDVLNEYQDVFIGITTWAAGAFTSSFALNEIPTWNGYEWVDVPIISQCLVPRMA